MQRRALLALLFACLLTTFGCSGKVHVTGRVTYPDGQPLTLGQVVFTNDQYMGRSDIDKNGEYSIHSEKRNDGLYKGTYKVYITSVFRFEEAAPTPDKLQAFRFDKPVSGIDHKYTNPDLSGWVFDIKRRSKIDLVVYPPGEAPEDETSKEEK